MSVPSNSILSRLIVACVLAASAYGQDAAVIGPYVQDVRSTAATICWATRSGETKLTGPSGESIVREYSMHKTVLPRLKPGTKYQYSVEADGNVPLTGEFTTFPEKDEPFRFVVFGDTRSRHEIHARLVKRIADEKPLFVINTGDLVSDGRSMADWEKFFEVSGGLMRTIPYYPVLGNHENDSQHYYDFFCLPGNERYYTFHAGGVLFLMLDTEGPEVEVPAYVPEAEEDVFVTEQLRPYMETQKAWVDEMLKQHRQAPYVFAVFHEPLFSAKASRLEDTAQRRAFWGDIFERNQVQVAFNGHDHHYHHAVHGGTHYVVTGGGGASLYEVDAPQPETVKATKIEHYLRIEVGPEETKLTAIDIEGETIEEFEVPRRK